MEIFAVRWNVVYPNGRYYPTEWYQEAGSGIENIMTDRLDLDGLQVEWYNNKNYISQVNQALSRCFFSVLSERIWGGGINYFSTFHHACMYQLLLCLGFTLNLKNKKLKSHKIWRIYIKNIFVKKSVKTVILERVSTSLLV